MLQRTHTLVVVARSADALPKADWWMHPPVYFGLQLAYYNPCIPRLNPRTFADESIGFYGIRADQPYPKDLICDLSRDKIRYVLIVKAFPGKTIRMYHEGGINRLFRIATKLYIMNEAAMPLPLAA